MIERVARALWNAQSTKPDTWDLLHPSKQDGMRERARSAIEAIRDPGKEALIGARDWSRVYVGTPIGDDAATGCWQSMIDAALKE